VAPFARACDKEADMISFRILHVDNDPDIRNIVELSLGADPTFVVMSCSNGEDALAMAADRLPDLILCDVQLPDIDGAAMLARLRAGPSTAKASVVFTAGRAATSELERLKSLGAVAVISKPLDPTTLAKTVRDHLRFAKLATVGCDFAQRMRSDAATLGTFREQLRSDSDSTSVLEGLQSCVHKLAGAAGIFGFQAVSCTASTLEDSIKERLSGKGPSGGTEAGLDALLECIERA
jgi:CheY-like chemotaxis protein/HPt (histidine-containing phosphotransfer) domain-containing protein